MYMKLISIVPSNRKDKKYKATFELYKDPVKGNGARPTQPYTMILSTHFGAKRRDGTNYRDYTLMSNPKSEFYIKNSGEREKVRQAYLKRHAKEDWMKPMTAGSLSRWILWEKTTLPAAIKNFKRKFSV